MRPIDADAFKKYIDAQEGRPFIGCTVGEAMKILIDEQPTVQPEPTDIDAREAVYNLAEKIGIHQLFALTVELRGEPIQPEPHEGHWIPVSERLPEDLEEVNVTWVNRNPESYYESIKDKPFTTTAVHYKGEWYWLSATCVDYLAEYGRCDWNKVDKAIEIVAWMPLPKAYKPNK